MAYLRFFRRVQLAPGVRLNLSKSGPSVSLGIRGAHITMGRRGVTRTVGLPGTGVFYTSRSGHHTGTHTAPQFAVLTPADAPGRKRGGWGCLLWILLALIVLAVIGQMVGS